MKRPLTFLAVILPITAFAVARRPVESAIGLLTIAAGLVAWQFVYGRTPSGGLRSRR